MTHTSSRIDLVILAAVVGLLGGILGTLVASLFIAPTVPTTEIAVTSSGSVLPAKLDELQSRVARAIVEWYPVRANPEAGDARAFGIVVTSDGWVLGPKESASLQTVAERKIQKVQKRVSDPWTGFIMMKLDAENLTVVPWQEKIPAIGELVFAPTHDRGIRSMRVESVRGGSVIALDAAARPGDAGVPIFDREGRLIALGIASPGTSNLQAVPISVLIPAVGTVFKNGSMIRPDLGVTVQDLSALASPDLPRGARVLATKGPATRAGVRVGDVILAINNDPIDALHDLRSRLLDYAPGKEVRLELSRGVVLITLGAQKD